MGRKGIEKILIGGIEKDIRYHQVGELIKKGIIKSFSDIIVNNHFPITALCKQLELSPTFFYNQKTEHQKIFTPLEKRTYLAYNFKISHIVTLAKLFETTPVKMLSLILNDDIKHFKLNL